MRRRLALRTALSAGRSARSRGVSPRSCAGPGRGLAAVVSAPQPVAAPAARRPADDARRRRRLLRSCGAAARRAARRPRATRSGPAGRRRRTSGRSRSGRPSRPCRASRAGNVAVVPPGIEHRREGQVVVDVVGEDARRVAAVRVDADEGDPAARQRLGEPRAGAAPRRRSAGTRWRRTRAAPTSPAARRAGPGAGGRLAA